MDTEILCPEIRALYTPLAILGQGGMGRVYLCENQGELVALKVMGLASQLGTAQATLEQFRQEAHLLSQLHHQHLVRIRNYHEFQGQGYLVMDYVRGQTLAEVLQQNGSLSLGQILNWAQQLCSVLEYLHSRPRPILFRDLKPSNVMVNEFGEIQLIDFGIARVLESGALTCTFLQGLGSSGYSPLEQYEGGTDERSDLYALGATLYHLLTGQVPLSAIEQVTSDRRLRPLRSYNPEVPAWLERAILKLMALRKSDRFDNAGQAALALAGKLEVIDEEPTEDLALPPVAPGRGQDRLVMAMAGLLTSLSLGLFGWMFSSQAEAATSQFRRTVAVQTAPAPLHCKTLSEPLLRARPVSKVAVVRPPLQRPASAPPAAPALPQRAYPQARPRPPERERVVAEAPPPIPAAPAQPDPTPVAVEVAVQAEEATPGKVEMAAPGPTQNPMAWQASPPLGSGYPGQMPAMGEAGPSFSKGPSYEPIHHFGRR